ncbi:MAG: hypothetical protein AB7F28_04580 [Candidatus Margulisiibacteriota bacterium]
MHKLISTSVDALATTSSLPCMGYLRNTVARVATIARQLKAVGFHEDSKTEARRLFQEKGPEIESAVQLLHDSLPRFTEAWNSVQLIFRNADRFFLEPGFERTLTLRLKIATHFPKNFDINPDLLRQLEKCVVGFKGQVTDELPLVCERPEYLVEMVTLLTWAILPDLSLAPSQRKELVEWLACNLKFQKMKHACGSGLLENSTRNRRMVSDLKVKLSEQTAKCTSILKTLEARLKHVGFGLNALNLEVLDTSLKSEDPIDIRSQLCGAVLAFFRAFFHKFPDTSFDDYRLDFRVRQEAWLGNLAGVLAGHSGCDMALYGLPAREFSRVDLHALMDFVAGCGRVLSFSGFCSDSVVLSKQQLTKIQQHINELEKTWGSFFRAIGDWIHNVEMPFGGFSKRTMDIQNDLIALMAYMANHHTLFQVPVMIGVLDVTQSNRSYVVLAFSGGPQKSIDLQNLLVETGVCRLLEEVYRCQIVFAPPVTNNDHFQVFPSLRVGQKKDPVTVEEHNGLVCAMDKLWAQLAMMNAEEPCRVNGVIESWYSLQPGKAQTTAQAKPRRRLDQVGQSPTMPDSPVTVVQPAQSPSAVQAGSSSPVLVLAQSPYPMGPQRTRGSFTGVNSFSPVIWRRSEESKKTVVQNAFDHENFYSPTHPVCLSVLTKARANMRRLTEDGDRVLHSAADNCPGCKLNSMRIAARVRQEAVSESPSVLVQVPVTPPRAARAFPVSLSTPPDALSPPTDVPPPRPFGPYSRRLDVGHNAFVRSAAQLRDNASREEPRFDRYSRLDSAIKAFHTQATSIRAKSLTSDKLRDFAEAVARLLSELNSIADLDYKGDRRCCVCADAVLDCFEDIQLANCSDIEDVLFTHLNRKLDDVGHQKFGAYIKDLLTPLTRVLNELGTKDVLAELQASFGDADAELALYEQLNARKMADLARERETVFERIKAKSSPEDFEALAAVFSEADFWNFDFEEVLRRASGLCLPSVVDELYGLFLRLSELNRALGVQSTL